MAFIPSRVKYRKSQRRSRTGVATRGSQISFGEYGLQALENGWVSHTQLEAARVALTRHVRRGGRVYIRVFPDKPISKKPAETRMGKGKGEVAYWAAVIKRGRVLVEMEGIPENLAKDALRLASAKIPLKTRFVRRMAGA
ncbi:MAG: 50S ribosomal protein L16 [Candidatus Omnitrophica bacterium CG11_big_fil_rev_8_21_14_0_20_64_10]|nr:MAG: 50S ribosomal protein L16 [Candidatus Omnitrophica bacterium CG11_big_fil_rev_8_21_14_0_20_64_10]